MLDPVVAGLVAEVGRASSLTACETRAAEHYSTLLQRMREAHALSGQMVACLEAGDLATFAALCGLYTRTNHGAGEALVCLDAVRSSEGSA